MMCAHCDRMAITRGWCAKHYQRWLRHNEPNTVHKTGPKLYLVVERFWKKINIKDQSDCWLWTGARLADGYGRSQLTIHGQRVQLAHRISWVLTYGPLTLDKPSVLHHCDNPPCCNPHHLFVGTQQDNVDDKVRKGRQANWR